MIFVTVGSQMPFDRLIAAVDVWAMHHPYIEILAQIGVTQFAPSYMRGVDAFKPSEFADVCQAAQLIIAHAGMGSILTALQYGKPIVVMPRKGALRETRNDHQLAAAKWLGSIDGVFFADDETALPAAIDTALARSLSPKPIAAHASAGLLDGLQQFISKSAGTRTR